MRVSEIAILPTNDYVQLQARVESDRAPDDGNRFPAFDLWYRFPTWCEPYLSPANGDPFLAALLVPAMLIDEPLTIEAPVSPRLLRRLPDLQSIYQSFDNRLKRSQVTTSRRAMSPMPAGSGATGLFLSLGVDSFYSLLKNVRDHPDDDETLSHLITLHGFEVSHDDWDQRFPPRLQENCARVAREYGKTWLPVITNLRPATRAISRWTLSHGATLASVALALDGLLRQVLIAASTTYDQLYPWGSHPVLDPLWSTENLTCRSRRLRDGPHRQDSLPGPVAAGPRHPARLSLLQLRPVHQMFTDDHRSDADRCPGALRDPPARGRHCQSARDLPRLSGTTQPRELPAPPGKPG